MTCWIIIISSNTLFVYVVKIGPLAPSAERSSKKKKNRHLGHSLEILFSSFFLRVDTRALAHTISLMLVRT